MNDDTVAFKLLLDNDAIDALAGIREMTDDGDWCVSYALVMACVDILRVAYSSKLKIKGCRDLSVRRAIKAGGFTVSGTEVQRDVKWVDAFLFPEAIEAVEELRKMSTEWKDYPCCFAIKEMYAYVLKVTSEREAVKNGCIGITNRLYSAGFFSGFQFENPLSERMTLNTSLFPLTETG